ncbi:MAG: peroxidase-related enzyme [Alphaproteobacteria bacterium]|jgi:uncharacterized peroxidase-related enzyme|nr:peroxidase-related enzyme [Alphaproteobacteria bacterium]MDP6566803.1 peroxidase-related enzyme [Alphaproteobacteria bacterium]MDP6813912.1 peroxidase-related enzyme [Alphaproteobacteria bacterium]
MSFLKSQPRADLKAVLKLDPELGLPFAAYHQALLRGPSPLSVAERELIGAFVSGLNACEFCYGEHAAVAEAFGMAPGVLEPLLHDIDGAALPDRLKAILKYVRKLNDTPERMSQADADAVFAAGWDDIALYHAAAVCALFNMNNRIINGLGIPAHGPDKLAGTVERLHREGYASTVAFVRGDWSEEQ